MSVLPRLEYLAVGILCCFLSGCMAGNGTRLECVQVFRAEEAFPQGTKILDQVAVHSARSEAFCLRKLKRKAIRMGGNAIWIHSHESSSEQTSDFYPPLGRRLEREWIEHSMKASVLLIPQEQISSAGDPVHQETMEKACHHDLASARMAIQKGH